MAKYRRRVDIIADILRIAADGAKKTRIMYIANLSYSLLEKYLDQTISMGFVQSNGHDYQATEKGRSFLEKYLQVHGKYSELQRQLDQMRHEREVLEQMCEPTNERPRITVSS